MTKLKPNFPSISDIFTDVQVEINRARVKFPGLNVNLLAFVEEAGELVKAALHEVREDSGTPEETYWEGIQVIAMVIRFLQEGDPYLSVGLTPKGDV